METKIKTEIQSEEPRNRDGLTEAEFLANYREGDYRNPSCTADMLLFTVDNRHVKDVRKDAEKELKILLIRRKDHPDIHKWALPGGFVNFEEDVEHAATRELAEETSVRNVYMEQLYTFGKVGRDKRTRVISIAHVALVPRENVKPIAGDDAEEVSWFSVRKDTENVASDCVTEKLVIENEDLGLRYEYRVETTFEQNGVIPIPKSVISATEENNRIAFDHIEMINMGIDRLRNKVEYIPIAFNLVPPKFTLNDIQKVYEVILGRKLVKQNFRKWIDKFVEELPEKQEEVGHRPASLYRYKTKKISDLY